MLALSAIVIISDIEVHKTTVWIFTMVSLQVLLTLRSSSCSWPPPESFWDTYVALIKFLKYFVISVWLIVAKTFEVFEWHLG